MNRVLVASAVLASVVLAGCSGTTALPTITGPSPTPGASPRATRVEPSASTVPVDPRVDARIDCPEVPVADPRLPASPRDVPSPPPGLPTPGRYDLIYAGVPPGTPPVSDGRYVWIAQGDLARLQKIDTGAGKLVSILRPGPFPFGLVLRDGYVWYGAVHEDVPGGYLGRIDPQSDEVVECLRLGNADDGSPIRAEFLAAAGDLLWVASFTNDRVMAVDLTEGRVVADIPSAEAHGIAAGDDGAWSLRHHSGILMHVDPETFEATEIDTGLETSEYVALTRDAVWVAGGERGDLVALSRDEHSPLVRIEGRHFESIVSVDETVWAVDVIDDPALGAYGRVVEIDAEALEVRREYPLTGLRPTGVIADPSGERLFVTSDTGYLIVVEVD